MTAALWQAGVVIVLIGIPCAWLARMVNRIGVVVQSRAIVRLHKRIGELEDERRRLAFRLDLEQSLVRRLGGDPLFPPET